jgi:chromosome partitioning protein
LKTVEAHIGGVGVAHGRSGVLCRCRARPRSWCALHQSFAGSTGYNCICAVGGVGARCGRIAVQGAAPFVVTCGQRKRGRGQNDRGDQSGRVPQRRLREDLPVTIASFDNHFSVDAMFAIGGRRGSDRWLGCFRGACRGESLATLGEYGVQFLASERESARAPPGWPGSCHAMRWPGRHLERHPDSGYPADSRLCLLAVPWLRRTWCWRPIKERSSLVNVAALLRAIKMSMAVIRSGSLWVMPSLVDARLQAA